MTSTLTPITFINGIINAIQEDPKVSPIFWEVPTKDEPKHRGGGIAMKGKVVLHLLPNEYSSTLLSTIVNGFNNLGFRHFIHGDAQDVYSFVHDSLTNDISSLRNLTSLLSSPRDQHETDTADVSSLSLPLQDGNLERSGLQMRPRPRGDAAHSANNTYYSIIVRVRPSANGLGGITFRGKSSRGWLRFHCFNGVVEFLVNNLHLIPTQEEINQNTVYMCGNGRELVEGDILTQINNCKIDVNVPFDDKVKLVNTLVGEAVDSQSCMTFLFYRLIDTGAVTGSTITTNNTSATNSMHVSDAMREQRNRHWESIRLLAESKERDNNTGQKSTVAEDPPIEDDLDFGGDGGFGGGGDTDNSEEENEKEEDKEEEKEVNIDCSSKSRRSRRDRKRSWKVLDNESQGNPDKGDRQPCRKRKLERDDDVFRFDSDDDEDDDMPIMARHRKRRKIMVGDSMKKRKRRKNKHKKQVSRASGRTLASRPRGRLVTLININTFKMTEHKTAIEAAKVVSDMLGDESIKTISLSAKIGRLLDKGGGIWHWDLEAVPFYLHPTDKPLDHAKIVERIWYGGTKSDHVRYKQQAAAVTLININTFKMTEHKTLTAATEAVIEMLGDESFSSISTKIRRLLNIGGGIWHWDLEVVPFYFHPTKYPLDHAKIVQVIWYGMKSNRVSRVPVTLININTFEMKEYHTRYEAAKAIVGMLGDESFSNISVKIGRLLDKGGGIWHWDLEAVPFYFHPTDKPLDHAKIVERIWYGNGSLNSYTMCSECTGRAQYPLGLWKGLCAVCFRNKYDVQPIQLQMAERFADLDFTSMFQKIVIQAIQSKSFPDFHRVISESKKLLWLEDDGNGHSYDSHNSNDLAQFTTDANVYIMMGYSVGLIRYDHKNYPELDEYHEQVIREVWHELLADDFTGFRIVYINFDRSSRRYLEAAGEYGTFVKRVVIDKSNNKWEYADDTNVRATLGQLAV